MLSDSKNILIAIFTFQLLSVILQDINFTVSTRLLFGYYSSDKFIIQYHIQTRIAKETMSEFFLCSFHGFNFSFLLFVNYTNHRIKTIIVIFVFINSTFYSLNSLNCFHWIYTFWNGVRIIFISVVTTTTSANPQIYVFKLINWLIERT